MLEASAAAIAAIAASSSSVEISPSWPSPSPASASIRDARADASETSRPLAGPSARWISAAHGLRRSRRRQQRHAERGRRGPPASSGCSRGADEDHAGRPREVRRGRGDSERTVPTGGRRQRERPADTGVVFGSRSAARPRPSRLRPAAGSRALRSPATIWLAQHLPAAPGGRAMTHTRRPPSAGTRPGSARTRRRRAARRSRRRERPGRTRRRPGCRRGLTPRSRRRRRS